MDDQFCQAAGSTDFEDDTCLAFFGVLLLTGWTLLMAIMLQQEQLLLLVVSLVLEHHLGIGWWAGWVLEDIHS